MHRQNQCQPQQQEATKTKRSKQKTSVSPAATVGDADQAAGGPCTTGDTPDEPDECLTANQIADRPGWTRTMVALANLEPEGQLGRKYRFASLYSLAAIKKIEAMGLDDLRARAERADRERAEEQQQKRVKREQAADRRAARNAELPAPTAESVKAIGQHLTADVSRAATDAIEWFYCGSNAKASRQLYQVLEDAGDCGPLAAWLLRAQKTSSRAKGYRGSAHDHAYASKEAALGVVCSILVRQETIIWGWGIDEKNLLCQHVLYVELPTGQVSFHAPERGAGPDYGSEWDGKINASQPRIMAFAGAVLTACRPDAARALIESADADRKQPEYVWSKEQSRMTLSKKLS